MRSKALNMKAMLANIGGLSLGDRAYCGPFGTVTCVRPAWDDPAGVRRFKVEGGTRLPNGVWTMKELRRAIAGGGGRGPGVSGPAKKRRRLS